MNQILVDILHDVNGVKFGEDRENARKMFGRNYSEAGKDVFSQNNMDVYDSFHVYYDENDYFEAIEIFGDVSVVVNEMVVFPAKLESIRSVFSGLRKIESESYIDIEKSVGVTLDPEDGNVVQAILFGCRDYYSFLL